MDKKAINGKILVVNLGSGSKKYSLYANGREFFRAHLEQEGKRFISTVTASGKPKRTIITKKEYDSAVPNIVPIGGISACGIRIVAPGSYFLKHRVINRTYLREMKKAQKLAPLHLDAVFSEIKNIRKLIPGAVQIGISDSAFHGTMPDVAKLYSIPLKNAERLDIKRFGYHGISAESLLLKIKAMLGEIPPRIIVCHLGSGSSIHAIKKGKSFDTSMGFTPLEGVPMGTRIGNIDSGAIVHLWKGLGFDSNGILEYLTYRCGLLGYSGKTADVRELIALEKKGDRRAKLALDAFVYWVRKYIGAYAAALCGIDLIVFTATMGERSPIMRNRICKDMKWLGVELDGKKNANAIGRDGLINSRAASVKIAVLATDEMGEIARKTALILSSQAYDH